MRLRNDTAGELLAPVVVMTLRATHVDLAAPLSEQLPAGLDERCETFVAWRRDRHAARLPSDIGCECQQVMAFERQWRRLLMFAAAKVDALFDIDRGAARRAERRVTRGNALHAHRRILVTIGTRAVGGACFLIPQRFAVKHP